MPLRLSAAPLRLLRLACTMMATQAVHVASAADVYKCVSAGGQVTYQQAPCAGGQRETKVELEDAVALPPGGDDSMWSATAREGRVIVGMPKPFVTAALGRPREIRATREGEAGSEVWVYQQPASTTRIGFQNNVVAWIRSDLPTFPSAERTGSALPGARAGNEREARVREALAVGRECAAVLQEAGRPDREETLAAGTTSGSRYVYEFDAKNANAYAAFVCLAGRVTSVERYTPEAPPAPGGAGGRDAAR